MRSRFHMRAIEHFYMIDISLDFNICTPSINTITQKVGSSQSRTIMACFTKLLPTQTREKCNEKLIQTHTKYSIRELLMKNDCGSTGLPLEEMVLLIMLLLIIL